MFFTTEITVPFETLKEAVLAYPEWKLRLKQGDEGFVFVLASDGDEEAVTLFDRIQNSPDKAQFQSVEEGIKKMTTEKSAILLSENELRLYNRHYPIKQNFKVFPGDWDVNGVKGKMNEIIVPENSPLGPVLSRGFQLLYENGMMTALEAKWVGRQISKKSLGINTFVLKPGQLMLGFSLLSMSFICSLIVCVIEHFTCYLLKSQLPYLI